MENKKGLLKYFTSSKNEKPSVESVASSGISIEKHTNSNISEEQLQDSTATSTSILPKNSNESTASSSTSSGTSMTSLNNFTLSIQAPNDLGIKIEGPQQPKLEKFPFTEFGKKCTKRAFNADITKPILLLNIVLNRMRYTVFVVDIFHVELDIPKRHSLKMDFEIENELEKNSLSMQLLKSIKNVWKNGTSIKTLKFQVQAQ